MEIIFGIPYASVAGHSRHIREGVLFSGQSHSWSAPVRDPLMRLQVEQLSEGAFVSLTRADHATGGNSTADLEDLMTGTPRQIELAEHIRTLVGAEFGRVANALIAPAQKQTELDRADTKTVAILEEKRADIIGRDEAGYFIREWLELSDQVRRMIADDSRYRAFKAKRGARWRRTCT